MAEPTRVFINPGADAQQGHRLAALLGASVFEVHPVSELPIPDRSQPTYGQQRAQRAGLLRERASLRIKLTACLAFLTLAESFPHRYSDQLAELRQVRDKIELRIQEITRTLGEESGVEL